MIKTKAFLAYAAAVALLTGGCASVEGEFPSLSKRPYETDNPVALPTPAPPQLTTVLPADLRVQTDGLLARARRAHDAFQATLPAARAAAQSANGAASGTESWVNAHMILSRSDAARADAVAALSEIDRLISLERNKGADAGLLALLTKPQEQIAELVRAESQEINGLAMLIGL